MRLIDEESITYGGELKEIEGELYIKVSDVEKCLKSTPTAYDLGRVLNQLEQLKQIHNEYRLRTNDDAFARDLTQRIKSLDETIEIIKKGGSIC